MISETPNRERPSPLFCPFCFYPHESSSSLYSLTKIDAGLEADSHPPLTVFFYDKHYQTLQKDESDSSKDSCKTEVSDKDENTDKGEENCLDSNPTEESETSVEISKTVETKQDGIVQDLELNC